jgi:GT2 family glycosyltransferase
MKHPIKTCIILVNYNGFNDTIECIESLLELSNHNFKIVICDNDSKDNSINKLKAWHNRNKLNREGIDFAAVGTKGIKTALKRLPKITLIRSVENLGFAGGNNLAARYAMQHEEFDYYWFLNNDTVVDHNSLSFLVSYAEKLHKKTGIIGSKLRYYHQPEKIQAVGGLINRITGQPKHIGGNEIDNGQYDNSSTTMDYIVGASMFVSNKMIKSTGLMSEHFFLYYEEIDWITRIKKTGWSIAYCPESIIYHKEGASTGGKPKGTKSVLSAYYSTRSSLIYNFNYNKRYFIFVFVYTLIIAFSKLIRIKMKSFSGMIKGIFGFIRFQLKLNRAKR